VYHMHLRIGVIGFVALLALASVARADYCITDQGNTSYVLDGRGFVMPRKGQCKVWTGFTAQLGLNSPTAGTACKSSDGSHLNLTLTTSFPEFPGGFLEIDSITLDLPAQSGTSNFNSFSGGSQNAGSFPVMGAVCSPPPAIPAVSATPGAATVGGSVGGGQR
jgi:hypothetical protein